MYRSLLKLRKFLSIRWLIFLVFVLVGSWLVRNESGLATINWMFIHGAEDIIGWSGLLEFYRNLRTGISPVWSLLEIFSYQVYGNYRITAIWLYRVAIVGSFALPFMMFKKGSVHFAFSVALASLFILVSVLVHRSNPAIIDFFTSILTLLFFILLHRLNRESSNTMWTVFLAFTTGFVLSFLELTRPYIFFMLPWILMGSYLSIRHLGKKTMTMFLLPVVLLTGGWHAHQLVNFGQVTWTNHTGFNLMRAWDPIMDEWQTMVEPEEPPLAEGRMTNINTAVHSRNSSLLKSMVIEGMIDHPLEALNEASWNLKILLDGKTCILGKCPEHWILKPYKLIVKIVAGWYFLSLICFVIRWWKVHNERSSLLGEPQNQLLLFLFLSILLLAFGDKGEDARFLLSILPLFTVLAGMDHVKWAAEKLKISRKPSVL